MTTNLPTNTSTDRNAESPMQPDSWIYDRSVLGWLSQPHLRQQLPLPYQIFALYAQLYFQITYKSSLWGGRKLFRFLSNVFTKSAPDRYLELQLPNYRVFLNPTDARLFQVVNELSEAAADTQILAHLLSEGDTFLDVGANHGSFAIVASKLVGKSGFVLAVEPQPRLAEAINQSLTANALCQFQVHNVAVGDREGEIELLVPLGTSGSAGIFPEHSATHEYYTFHVPLHRFDDLVDWQKFTGKVCLKLDVEGSECAFLEGATNMITALKPNLIIEIHPQSLKASGSTGDLLKQLLTKLGYTHYAEIEVIDQINHLFPLESLNTNKQRNVIIQSLS
ncbi:MAG: FkbM family methyltransferase [Pseudanabaenaceae cyanobacterium bins.39]|nr:FkbM family methyltransferase [Pseudanabaenaceae cyanobacterium bins.39]